MRILRIIIVGALTTLSSSALAFPTYLIVELPTGEANDVV